nr:type I restriction-modification system subunit M N-terminal domain-containing protein [Nocardioides faecalis]
MITGDLKSKIDTIWNAFWSGGIANPLEVIEQITYLLFIRRLDDLQTLAEKKANRTGRPIESPLFQPGQADLRWSKFKNFEAGLMHQVVGEGVFPFLRKLGGDGSTYSAHMKDARAGRHPGGVGGVAERRPHDHVVQLAQHVDGGLGGDGLGGARTPVNTRAIPPWRSRSRSSMESAPASIPPTTAAVFAAALGEGTVRPSSRS